MLPSSIPTASWTGQQAGEDGAAQAGGEELLVSRGQPIIGEFSVERRHASKAGKSVSGQFAEALWVVL